ncbi:MAG TPA: PQQ-binding-like beta-propeller repeat protein, partial [bacterium]|nr:PQQ-binding-like beta-propeller repeat protein [bacterium]
MNIDSNQAHVELVDDGAGGAYAALLGAGDSEVCVAGQVCHGAIWRLGAQGDVLWTHQVGYAVDAPFALPDGGVAWRGNDGGLHAANGDGSPRWDLSLGDVRLLAAPDAGAVLAVAGGNVVRVDAKTGAVAWTTPFPGADPTALVSLPDASAVVAGYSGTNGEFRRVAFEDGSTLFDVQVRATMSAPHVLYRWPYGPFVLAADRLSLVDWNGRESWGFDAPEGWRYVQALGSDWIGNGPYEQRITRLRNDGTALWVVPVPAPITWVSVTPDAQVLVGRNDGTLDKLKASDGLMLWEYGGIAGVKAPTPPRYSSKGNIVFAGANVGANSDTHLTTASE